MALRLGSRIKSLKNKKGIIIIMFQNNVSLAVRTPDVTRSNSNGWQHPFEWLATSVRNFSFTIRTARVIHLKFFLYRSNGWHHPFEIFPVPFERLHHPFEILPWPFERYLNRFERLEHPFLIRSLAIHQLFALTVQGGSKVFFVAILLVKRWKITKKDV